MLFVKGRLDRSGYSVSLLGDGKTVAIGVPMNDVGDAENTGHVRVYGRFNNDWSQLGQDIDGRQAGEMLGTSVAVLIK